MRVAVLCSPDSWYFRDLVRAAAVGEELIPLPFSEITSELPRVGGCRVRSGSVYLDECDAVIVRTMPPGSLEQVVFRMDCLGRHAEQGGVVLNSPRAIESAVDKFLTSAKLQAAGLLTPRTIVCQTFNDAMAAFASLGQDVVVKPLFGSEGRGIARITDEALAERAFKMLAQLGAALYVQEFIPHEGCDLRLLVIGQRVLGMRRRSTHDWRTNVSRGAIGEPLEVTPELAELALRAAAAVDAQIAGVDLLPARDGGLYALEVNAVPGWKALAKVLHVDAARLVLDHVAAQATRP
jgi:ribosomal protein S6--L-glutamate ligase